MKALHRKFARLRGARELFRALIVASFAARISVLEIAAATGINAACESRNQLLGMGPRAIQAPATSDPNYAN
jgi:hypothetical protein